MFITGLGTAVPPKCYKQAECWEALQASEQFKGLSSRSRAILRKVLLGANGIATRHLALDPLEEAFQISPDVLHGRFAEHAPTLATQAAERALAEAQIQVGDIDALVISTCTGYLCPGLTSYVAERLGLRADALLLDLVGQGCGAALPNLRTAASLITGGQSQNVLSVCVEVCSAAFYLDNDPGVLISACLFGDGAGAAVLSAKQKPGRRRVKWIAADSLLSTADRDLLRFETKDGLLRNILAPKVPEIAGEFARRVLHSVLEKNGQQKSDISTWIFHAGGRDVLVSLEEKLELTSSDLCWSSRILQSHGNLSSPFVYFVLKLALQESAPGGVWWMASFGAGFSSHGALLEVE